MRVGAYAPSGRASSRRPDPASSVRVSPEAVQRFGEGLASFLDVADEPNSFTFDYFHGQTTPSALREWSSDWIVGGSLHVFNTKENAVGSLSFASSPFFKLRLQCDDADFLESWLAGVRLELIKHGQWLGHGIIKGESCWKFAPSTRTFSGDAIGKAFVRNGWTHDRVRLWLFSAGAKMDFNEFYERAFRASKKHEHDVGKDLAELIESQCQVDMGRDRFTTNPVVVCPDLSVLCVGALRGGSAHIIPLWGRLGGGLGSFYLDELTPPFIKMKAYNKFASLWRAEHGTAFILGRQALFKTATVDFLSGRFRDTCEVGLHCLINDTAVHHTRVEVRRTVNGSLRDTSWFHDMATAIRNCERAMRVREILKPDLDRYCQRAFADASQAGLFSTGASHMADRDARRAPIARWQLHDGNRLAYALGWVYVRDVLSHYRADLNCLAWGPRAQVVVDAAYMLPDGFSIPDTYVCQDAPSAVGSAFAEAAHELANTGINWADVSPGDADAARELRALAMHFYWSRQVRRVGNSRFRLILTDAQDLGMTRTWDHLETAVVELLTTKQGGEQFDRGLFKAYGS